MLGVEPTTDKRKIKRAYAARSKEVHPEERPEEFRVLHGAYQAALKHAERARTGQTAGGVGSMSGEGRPASGAEPICVTEQPEVSEDVLTEQSGVSEDVSAEQPELAEAESVDREEVKAVQINSYFEEKAQEREEKIRFFREHWKDIRFDCWKPEVKEWWKNYLQSEDFQDIQWQPQLLRLLAEEMEKELQYEYEIRLLFWEAYGFQEKDPTTKGDLQKLRRALYPAYERVRRQEEHEKLEAQKQAGYRKNRKFLAWMLAFSFGTWCFVVVKNGVFERAGGNSYKGGRDYTGSFEEQYLQEYGESYGEQYLQEYGDTEEPEEETLEGPELVRAYVEERYPGTEFSEPVLVKEGVYSEDVYEMYALSHPDIVFEAVIEYDIIDDTICGMREEYGLRLTEYYATEYGLHSLFLAGGNDEWPESMAEYDMVSVLCYEDPDELDEFCDTVIRMFKEQEELQNLDAVGISRAKVCYPGVMVNGGTSGCYPGEGQFYRPWELSTDQMKEKIREGYETYMAYFEPWNLPLEQCLAWRAAYGEKEEIYPEETASDFAVTLSGKGGEVFEVYIPVYACDVFGYVTDADEEDSVQMILSGDAYYYLLSEGVRIRTEQEGFGFFAEKDGEFYYLGIWEKEELGKIEEFIPR